MPKKKNYEYTNEELAEIAIKNPDFQSPQFQLYVNDWLGSNKVAMMKPEAISGYFLLLLRSWNEKDCGLPADAGVLARLSQLSSEEFGRVMDSILINFFEYKGRYYNRRLLVERIKQIEKRQQCADAANSRYKNDAKDSAGEMRTQVPRRDFTDTCHMIHDNDKGINEEGCGEEFKFEVTDEMIQQLWIGTFGKNPTNPEKDKTRELIGRFGWDLNKKLKEQKVYKIMYDGNLKGFKRIITLINTLDDDGNIIPRDQAGKALMTYREMMERIHKSGGTLSTDNFEMLKKDEWRLKNGKK